MAPMINVDHDALEKQLKDTIQSLHNIMVQVTYDANATSTSPPSTSPAPAPQTTTAPTTAPAPTTTTAPQSSREVLADEMTALSRSLQTLHRTATTRPLPHVPPELVQYVDNGRNPDVYTREFVELVRRGNQLMRGKQNAFAAFRDILAGEIESAMPELRDDVARVLAATGGRGSNTNANAGAGAGANAGAGAGTGAEAKTTTTTTTTTGLEK
ncbi:transcription factor subunit Med10 of mediator complex-domain-containing protein [Nemania serpens]|nr:transcription factor subunit Med10 of mediator complex-domain-containing protein [Nemania serpens]